MEKTVYFVERLSDHKWLSFKAAKNYHTYTSSPDLAVHFETREQAECCLEEGEIVTEHLFIDDTQTTI